MVLGFYSARRLIAIHEKLDNSDVTRSYDRLGQCSNCLCHVQGRYFSSVVPGEHAGKVAAECLVGVPLNNDDNNVSLITGLILNFDTCIHPATVVIRSTADAVERPATQVCYVLPSRELLHKTGMNWFPPS